MLRGSVSAGMPAVTAISRGFLHLLPGRRIARIGRQPILELGARLCVRLGKMTTPGRRFDQPSRIAVS
jgi:hypothetical protein